jgi:hypothetical protein
MRNCLGAQDLHPESPPLSQPKEHKLQKPKHPLRLIGIGSHRSGSRKIGRQRARL